MASWLWGRRRRLFRRAGEVNLSPAEMIKYSATSRVGHASPWLTLQQDLGQNRSLTADEDFNLGVRIWEISGLLGDKYVNTNLYTKPESDYLIRDNVRVGRAGEIMTDFLMWHQHYSGSSGVSRAHCTTYTPGIIIFHPQHFQIIIPNIVNLSFLKMETKDIAVLSVS